MIDTIKGCLVGGAIGDALGYAVEFSTLDEIISNYGSDGITSIYLENGCAIVSDDTQMTLFTAHGLIYSHGDVIESVHDCYMDWLWTQLYSINKNIDLIHPNKSWLCKIDSLLKSRAPGTTCINALGSGCTGSISKPINDSKGCGGLMRVAPVALYYATNKDKSIDEISLIGAEVASITHGHPLGYIPAYCLTDIVLRICRNKLEHEAINLKKIVNNALNDTCDKFEGNEYIDNFKDLMLLAFELSMENCSDIEAINKIGKGWVAEETLAISIYCCLKYEEDFMKAITTSVNHDGDSDSTGSITGNILGCIKGFDSIPFDYYKDIDLLDVLLEVAEEFN